MQNEIHKKAPCKRKVAFVEKKHEGLLCVQEAKRIILEAGGIPCYLMQADERRGLQSVKNRFPGLARRLTEMEFTP